MLVVDQNFKDITSHGGQQPTTGTIMEKRNIIKGIRNKYIESRTRAKPLFDCFSSSSERFRRSITAVYAPLTLLLLRKLRRPGFFESGLSITSDAASPPFE